MLTYEKLGMIGLSGRLYRFSEELGLDDWGRSLDQSTRYVLVSDSMVAEETCVFPIYLKDGYSEADMVAGIRESATMDFVSIVGDGLLLDDEEYLDRLLVANTEAMGYG